MDAYAVCPGHQNISKTNTMHTHIMKVAQSTSIDQI
jgi:hypothetical protein